MVGSSTGRSRDQVSARRISFARIICALACLVAAQHAWPATASADPGTELAASIRAGTEYDDNVFRREGEGKEGGFLSRYFGSLDLVSPTTSQGLASFSATHGGKFFFSDAHGGADTLLTQAALGYRHRLADPLGAWVSADMKDRTEREPKRDYLSASSGAGLEAYLPRTTLRAGLGWRYFAFKPSSDSSSSNLEGQSQLKFRIVEGLDLALGYTHAARSFETGRYERANDEVQLVEDELREDRFNSLSIGLGYRGPVVAEATYRFAMNSSNSYGQGLRRQAAEITVTAPLPWQFFVSGHVELQRTSYDDPVLIDASFLVDEDNRNAVVLSVVRALGEHFEIEARYSLYLQEFGVGSDYRRQTALVAFGWVTD